MPANQKHDRPKSPDPIATLDAILELVAEEETESGEETAEDRQWSAALDVAMKARIAELRRQLTPDYTIETAPPIPREIQRLDRRMLLACIETLRQSERVQYAQQSDVHQDVTGSSDDDLRRLLARLARLGKPTER